MRFLVNSSLIEELSNVFVQKNEHYFSEITKTSPKTKIPYLKGNIEQELLDYSGMITVSGSKKGHIFVSGDASLFSNLIEHQIGISSDLEEDLLGMAGELGNVISGNLRENFGKEYYISTPATFSGAEVNIPDDLLETLFVIPFSWNDHEAKLIVGIE